MKNSERYGKKINLTFEEVEEIFYKTATPHPMVQWTMLQDKLDETYFLAKEWKLSWFILFYIPQLVITFFYCLWDGGLSEFSLPEKVIYSHWLGRSEEERYLKAEKIYKEKA